MSSEEEDVWSDYDAQAKTGKHLDPSENSENILGELPT